MATELREALVAAGFPGDTVKLGRIGGDKPEFDENDAARIRAVIGELGSALGRTAGRREDAAGWLAVTHGDIIGQAVEMSSGETVLECKLCGWAGFVANDSGKLVRSGQSCGVTAVRLG